MIHPQIWHGLFHRDSCQTALGTVFVGYTFSPTPLFFSDINSMLVNFFHFGISRTRFVPPWMYKSFLECIFRLNSVFLKSLLLLSTETGLTWSQCWKSLMSAAEGLVGAINCHCLHMSPPEWLVPRGSSDLPKQSKMKLKVYKKYHWVHSELAILLGMGLPWGMVMYPVRLHWRKPVCPL